MKNTSLKHLFYALAAALAIPTAALATAMPVVEWDGSVDVYSFTNLTRTVGANTYTLNLNDMNTVAEDGSYIQIGSDNQKKGVTLTVQNSNPAVTNGFGTAGAITVVMRCSGIRVSDGSNRALISLLDSGKYQNGDNSAKIGMSIWSQSSWFIWEGAYWGVNASVQDVLTSWEHTVALTYSSSSGTAFYVDGSPNNSTNGLKSSYFKSPCGIALGGIDADNSKKYFAMTGMRIKAIAVFTNTLSAAEVADYDFLSTRTRSYSGMLPAISGDFFTPTTVPTWIADATKWNGTIKLSSIPRQWPLTLTNYVNACSAVEVDGVGARNSSGYEGEHLANGKIADKLILSGNGMTLTDGSSYYVSEIGELAGTGNFSQNKSGLYQGLTINVMTNFTGTLSPNEMTVTFGTGKRAGRDSSQHDTEFKKKLYIDPDAVLSVPAGFELWSTEAVMFNGTVNFTTDKTGYEELVLFQNIGRGGNVTFGNNAVIKINGKEYDKSLYFIRIKNSNLVLCKRHIFTIYVR